MIGGVQTELILRTLARAVHLFSSMIILTILSLEYFFQLDKHLALQENESYKRLHNMSGMGMIGSGVVLTAMMRRTDALPSQNKWLSFFPPKFFMSLLLTPISDKIALILVGSKKRMAD